MKRQLVIEGVADFSSISRDVQAMAREMKSAFGDDGAKLIDDSSMAFLKKEAPAVFGKMNEQLAKLRKEAEELDAAIKGSTGDQKKQEALSAKRLANTRKLVALEKELRKFTKGMNVINNGGQPIVKEVPKAGKGANTGAPEDNVVPFDPEERKKKKAGKGNKTFSEMFQQQAMSGASHIASEIPGAAPAMEVGSAAMSAGKAASAAGLGAPAIAALAGLAVAAAAAAVVISRMAAGFEVYKQGREKLLALTGMDIKPIREKETLNKAANLGYDQLKVLDTQKSLAEALGAAKSPKEDQNRLINVMTAARDMGMDPEQVSGAADQLRTVGGTEVANKQIAMIMEKALTNSMDKSQSTHFLSAAVGLLTEINQNGTANTGQMLSVMSDLVSKGKMSPEQIARTMGGMNSAVAGSTGENNSFFQTAAVRAGLGGGSILGTKFAVQEGLTGTNLGTLQDQVGDTDEGRKGIKAMKAAGLGDENFTRKMAGGILDRINQMVDSSGNTGETAKLGITSELFGTKTAGETTKVLALLERMSKPGNALSKDDKKLLADLGKDPQETWREQTLGKLDEIARHSAESEAFLKNGQFELGERSSEYINKLNTAMQKLDETILKVLNSETFRMIETGLGAVANVLSTVVGGAFTDLMKIPGALGEIFTKFMDNPMEFGMTLGKGFANVVLSTWDVLLGGLKTVITAIFDVVTHPMDTLKNVGTVMGKVADAVAGAASHVANFGKGVILGSADAMYQHDTGGKVEYSEGEQKLLDNYKDVAKGFYGATTPGLAVRAAGAIMDPVNPGSASAAPAQTQQTFPTVNVDVSEMVGEQKKTNFLLEKASRPGGAPRTGRETTRP